MTNLPTHERPTAFQRQVAAALKLKLLPADSRNKAAARILDYIGQAINTRQAKEPATPKQRAFARSLGLDVSRSSRRVASVSIAETLRSLNGTALRKLRLKPGDRVLRRRIVEFDNQRIETIDLLLVSSIHATGRVFFKGGQGEGAWPTQLEKASPSKVKGRRFPEVRFTPLAAKGSAAQPSAFN
jgi:carboxylesterase type B